jgi:hypothetical protein
MLMDQAGAPPWPPISRLLFMIEHMEGGVRLAQEHLALLEQTRGQ